MSKTDLLNAIADVVKSLQHLTTVYRGEFNNAPTTEEEVPGWCNIDDAVAYRERESWKQPFILMAKLDAIFPGKSEKAPMSFRVKDDTGEIYLKTWAFQPSDEGEPAPLPEKGHVYKFVNCMWLEPNEKKDSPGEYFEATLKWDGPAEEVPQ